MAANLPGPSPEREQLPGESMIQAAVMAIWQDILERNDIGLDDNFFDIGGNSARLVATHKQLEELVQRKLPLVELFRYTTVRAVSAWLQSTEDRPAVASLAASRRGAGGLARVVGLRRSHSAGGAGGIQGPDNQGVLDA
jgi:hypothetical protein